MGTEVEESGGYVSRPYVPNAKVIFIRGVLLHGILPNADWVTQFLVSSGLLGEGGE